MSTTQPLPPQEEMDPSVAHMLASNFVAELDPHAPSVVYWARIPIAWAQEITAETTRRGLADPAQLVKDLVREGLDRAAAAGAAR
ncbi:hypothetical protein EV385_6692 [Krasilnikovia cinnamomea]|uniref:Uncharacterized protein n=1 Tax=Krasilnikovia cinnamomea TaxID=349313 RepID=A0A4Q7Z7Z0_9ACTN|nr:hypothetical protein [Krasilnikovia cinnamomea]RZU46617.1 hypothetical protein EV385_6692 [Krasilnikovia cinnamomea]